jgi:hypothetical protein
VSDYSNGRKREYKVRDHMIDHGWTWVMRASSSKGCADLLMAHPVHGAALVQVGSKSKEIGPAARERFLHAAELCSALPLLAVVIPRRGIRYWVVGAGSGRTWAEWEVS